MLCTHHLPKETRNKKKSMAYDMCTTTTSIKFYLFILKIFYYFYYFVWYTDKNQILRIILLFTQSTSRYTIHHTVWLELPPVVQTTNYSTKFELRTPAHGSNYEPWFKVRTMNHSAQFELRTVVQSSNHELQRVARTTEPQPVVRVPTIVCSSSAARATLKR